MPAPIFGGMAKGLPVTRFFKVMMPGFHAKLSLPPAFCKQFTGETTQKAVLKSPMGLWQLKVARCCKGGLYFEEGWTDFVQKHGLFLGDFVFFEHKGDMVFNVLLLDSSACEIAFPPSEDLAAKSKRKRSSCETKSPCHINYPQGQNQKPSGTCQIPFCEGPHFIVTMTRSNGYSSKPYMNIPSEFAKANLVRRSMVILQDPSKKVWPMILKFRKTNTSVRTSIGKGWHEFYVAHQLKPGDVCLFELNLPRKGSSAVFMDVLIFRK